MKYYLVDRDVNGFGVMTLRVFEEYIDIIRAAARLAEIREMNPNMDIRMVIGVA